MAVLGRLDIGGLGVLLFVALLGVLVVMGVGIVAMAVLGRLFK